MIVIDGKEYLPKVPMNRSNGAYNSALIYYRNTLIEIDELKKELKKYARRIKELDKEDKK